MANAHGLDLGVSVCRLLTRATTEALPSEWRGDYSIERTRRWIAERDGESPTLLVVDRVPGRAIGVVILFESASDEDSGVDLRIGYLFDETAWGKGLATELVAGLVVWARTQPIIRTLTGGVEATNPASARVLAKIGFTKIGAPEGGEVTYQLGIDPTSASGD